MTKPMTLRRLLEKPQGYFDLVALYYPTLQKGSFPTTDLLEAVESLKEKIGSDPTVADAVLDSMPIGLANIIQSWANQVEERVESAVATKATLTARIGLISLLSFAQYLVYEPWASARETPIQREYEQFVREHPSFDKEARIIINARPLIDPVEILLGNFTVVNQLDAN